MECNRKCHYQAERFRSGDKKNCKSKGSWGFPLFKRVTLGTCFTLVCQWELRDNLLWWYAIQVLEVIRWQLILFIWAPAIGKCRFLAPEMQQVLAGILAAILWTYFQGGRMCFKKMKSDEIELLRSDWAEVVPTDSDPCISMKGNKTFRPQDVSPLVVSP